MKMTVGRDSVDVLDDVYEEKIWGISRGGGGRLGSVMAMIEEFAFEGELIDGGGFWS